MSSPVKVGRWGGEGGQPRDVRARPDRLLRVVAYSKGQAINAISFVYVDSHGTQHEEGPWGDPQDCTPQDIELGTSGYVKEISGTFGPLYSMRNIVTSLTFVTNGDKRYHYGNHTGTPFSVPLQDNGRILAFFGRAGDYLDAIGIYCA